MGLSVLGFKICDDDFISMALLREILAELLGTFFLVWLGCGGVQGATAVTPVGSSVDAAGVIQIAIAFSLGIAGVVHLFSDISGGQLNPAVSLGLFFARKLSLYRTVLLSVAQIIGGLVAAALLKAMFKKCPGVVAITGITTGQGLILEFVGTLFLVLTVLATINPKRGHSAGYLQPLSIGIAILVDHMFLVPLTGCGVNPARSLATNLIDGKVKSDFYVYIIGPLLASVVGGLVYEFLFDPHYTPSATHEPLNGDAEMKEEEA